MKTIKCDLCGKEINPLEVGIPIVEVVDVPVRDELMNGIVTMQVTFHGDYDVCLHCKRVLIAKMANQMPV